MLPAATSLRQSPHSSGDGCLREGARALLERENSSPD
jgi:hypothetical protein